MAIFIFGQVSYSVHIKTRENAAACYVINFTNLLEIYRSSERPVDWKMLLTECSRPLLLRHTSLSIPVAQLHSFIQR